MLQTRTLAAIEAALEDCRRRRWRVATYLLRMALLEVTERIYGDAQSAGAADKQPLSAD